MTADHAPTMRRPCAHTLPPLPPYEVGVVGGLEAAYRLAELKIVHQ